MLELYQLEQFVTIAREGTISKAAEVLHISQPGLSRSMQRLEEEVGIALFERKKNKISLNDNGRLMAVLAQEILDKKKDMIEQVRRFDYSNRSIRIGAIAPAPLWGLIYACERIAPEMLLSSTIDGSQKHLLAGLQNEEYSIIVLNHPIQDFAYRCVELFQEQLYLSLPTTHPKALFKEISFKELDGESVLLLSRIGFWNEICVQNIPQSHLLIQEDMDTFSELTRVSSLPNFRSNITIAREEKETNRIAIPIIDQKACATYYAVYPKTMDAFFHPIKEIVSNIDWKQTRHIEL